ncbi:MAG TPA: IPT/TIG domain-containing protein [Thermoanaerobaculia bacterium]|nr:IPT/TIG domain-containing protein [Thermoanaerobaculia bacterium]
MRTVLLLLAALAVSADAAPALQRVFPTRGVTFMQVTVQIYGVELTPGPVRVLFDDVPATVLRATPNQLTVLAPHHSRPGRADVHVELANGTRLTLDDAFEFGDVYVRRDDYRVFLLPLRAGDRGGANGSLWRTELSVHNGSLADALLLANNCDVPIRTPFCAHSFIPVRPGQSLDLPIAPGLAHLEGTFLYVPEELAEGIDAKMRVRDVSKADEGFGTEVPVVRLDELKETIRLLDVPTDPRYRALLRIYGDSAEERFVTVTVYPMSGDEPLERRTVYVERGVGMYDDPEFPFVSAFGRLDPITEAVRASGHSRVRIHIEAATRQWAFVSITNNATQQVTTVTPHR